MKRGEPPKKKLNSLLAGKGAHPTSAMSGRVGAQQGRPLRKRCRTSKWPGNEREDSRAFPLLKGGGWTSTVWEKSGIKKKPPYKFLYGGGGDSSTPRGKNVTKETYTPFFLKKKKISHHVKGRGLTGSSRFFLENVISIWGR